MASSARNGTVTSTANSDTRNADLSGVNMDSPRNKYFDSNREYYVHCLITQREFEKYFKCENLTTEDTEGTEEDTELPPGKTFSADSLPQPRPFF